MPIIVTLWHDPNVLFPRKKKSVAIYSALGERNGGGDVGRKGFPCVLEEDKF